MSQPIADTPPAPAESDQDVCEIQPREVIEPQKAGRAFGIPHVVARLDQAVLATLDSRQSMLLEQAIKLALPRNTPKLVDLRFTIPTPRGRLFVVLQMGRDRGRTPLGRLMNGAQRALNYAIGLVVILGLVYAALFGLYWMSNMMGFDFIGAS